MEKANNKVILIQTGNKRKEKSSEQAFIIKVGAVLASTFIIIPARIAIEKALAPLEMAKEAFQSADRLLRKPE